MDNAPIVIDDDEMAEYIFNRLIAQGIAITRDEIKTILSLEMDYMIEIGLAEP